MLCAIFRILYVFLLFSATFGKKFADINFIRNYLNFDPSPKIITALLCWNNEELLEFSKVVYDENYRLTILDTRMFVRNIEPVDEIRQTADLRVSLEKKYEVNKTVKTAEGSSNQILNLDKNRTDDKTQAKELNQHLDSETNGRNGKFLTADNNTKLKRKYTYLKLLNDIPKFIPLEFNFYILDADCWNSEEILKIANDTRKFSAPFKWLILTQDFSKLEDIVKDLNIFPDGKVVFSEQSKKIEYILKEAYRIDGNTPMLIKNINKWSESKGFENKVLRILSKERRNLQKKIMYTATFFPNNLTDHIWDYRDKHINTVSKMNVLINSLEMDYLNVTKNFIFTNSWGYKKPNSTLYDGIVGELQHGVSELGGVMFITQDRFPYIDYLTLFTPTRGVFIFKKPPLSYVYNIFTLPFSRMVWISSFCLLVLITIVAYFIIHIEWKQDPEGQKMGLTDSFFDVTLLTVGYMCMQGSPKEPVSPGARIAILFGCIALMFLYVSYSANIVSLLQSTADTINTFEDLLESGLKMGTEDTIYNRYYFSRMTEKTRKAIYERKIGPPGETPHFHDLIYGFKKVREGFYAFHCEKGVGYKVISDMFYEEEKCGLTEIANYIEVVDPWYTMKKNSSFKEIVRVGLRKIGDYGLNSRELQRLYTKKPECVTGGTNFVSVGIIDVYGAFLMLIVGGILSIFILLLEILVKLRCKTIHNRLN